MVTAAINTNYTRLTGKTIGLQAELNSKIQTAVICQTIAMCCDVYPMCAAGFVVDLSAGGRITTLLSVEVGNISDGACCADGYITEYRYAACCAAATGTLHVFECSAACAAAPFAEIPNCSNELACAVIRFRVIGF